VAHGVSHHLFRKFHSEGRIELKPLSWRGRRPDGSAVRSGPVNDPEFTVYNVEADDLL
jgi:hypothetical protein